MPPAGPTDDFDVLFELLGNRTRYRILRLLAQQPMFLGQLARELETGQQAILRHLRQLVEQGLLETYEDRSIRGPPRKYYRLSKCVRLAVYIAPDGVHIVRASPDEVAPRTVEDLLSRDYPELHRLVVQARRLHSIPGQLERRRTALSLIRELEAKLGDMRTIEGHIRDLIRRLRANFL